MTSNLNKQKAMLREMLEQVKQAKQDEIIHGIGEKSILTPLRENERRAVDRRIAKIALAEAQRQIDNVKAGRPATAVPPAPTPPPRSTKLREIFDREPLTTTAIDRPAAVQSSQSLLMEAHDDAEHRPTGYGHCKLDQNGVWVGELDTDTDDDVDDDQPRFARHLS